MVIEPATVIEHNVSMTGSPVGSYLPSGTNAPLRYMIDGMEAPDLVFRRGETHRFHFDSTTQEYPMSFLLHPEHEMPRVRLKMLVNPLVDQPGLNYLEPPEVSLTGGSSFTNYLSSGLVPSKITKMARWVIPRVPY